VDRFWQVDVTGTPVADLTFVYRDAELPASPYDDFLSMRAQRWSTAAGLWGDSLEGNSVAYSATATNVDAFGPFALTPISAPLPIELLSFDARAGNGVVDLDWATASERDNDFFTVMRSADGRNFVELLRVKGAGDSWTPIYYNAVDDAPLPGLSYYKLRQTDLDGTWSESAVVPVYFNTNTGSETLFPNPVVDRLTIAGLRIGALTVRLRDGAGRLLYTQMHSEGADRVEVPMDALAKGHYLAVVEYPSGEIVVLPFVRQ
jgi:hypothetical protein